jgi:hypothetical protein
VKVFSILRFFAYINGKVRRAFNFIFFIFKDKICPVMKHTDEVSVKGKVALVTGAARGIGRACALALAEAGADIALGLRDERSDNGLVKEIEAMGQKSVTTSNEYKKHQGNTCCSR